VASVTTVILGVASLQNCIIVHCIIVARGIF